MMCVLFPRRISTSPSPTQVAWSLDSVREHVPCFDATLGPCLDATGRLLEEASQAVSLAVSTTSRGLAQVYQVAFKDIFNYVRHKSNDRRVRRPRPVSVTNPWLTRRVPPLRTDLARRLDRLEDGRDVLRGPSQLARLFRRLLGCWPIAALAKGWKAGFLEYGKMVRLSPVKSMIAIVGTVLATDSLAPAVVAFLSTNDSGSRALSELDAAGAVWADRIVAFSSASPDSDCLTVGAPCSLLAPSHVSADGTAWCQHCAAWLPASDERIHAQVSVGFVAPAFVRGATIYLTGDGTSSVALVAYVDAVLNVTRTLVPSAAPVEGGILHLQLERAAVIEQLTIHLLKAADVAWDGIRATRLEVGIEFPAGSRRRVESGDPGAD